MNRSPMRRALFWIARDAFHQRGEFRIINDLGIMSLSDMCRSKWEFSPEDARYFARHLFLMFIAYLLGRPRMPWVSLFIEKVQGINRVPVDPKILIERGKRWALATDNTRQGRKLMTEADNDLLPPMWNRAKKRVWEAWTPLGSVKYEWQVEGVHDSHPYLTHWVENGPRGALRPGKLFSVGDPEDWLYWFDLEEFDRNYRCFLTLLNAFIDQLNTLGRRYEQTGRFN